MRRISGSRDMNGRGGCLISLAEGVGGGCVGSRGSEGAAGKKHESSKGSGVAEQHDVRLLGLLEGPDGVDGVVRCEESTRSIEAPRQRRRVGDSEKKENGELAPGKNEQPTRVLRVTRNKKKVKSRELTMKATSK